MRVVAFTRVELLTVLAIAAVLGVIFFAGSLRAKRQAQERQCARILKSVGLAFRQWAIDSGDTYPMRREMSIGGSMESAANGEVFFTFVVMSNEINTPKILICPADVRAPATNFSSPLANSNLSYFVGVTADETEPRKILMGDRNLTNGPLSANRLLLLTTNSAPGWDHQLHRFRGNVSFADGSVQSVDIPRVRLAVTNAGSDNLLAFP